MSLIGDYCSESEDDNSAITMKEKGNTLDLKDKVKKIVRDDAKEKSNENARLPGINELAKRGSLISKLKRKAEEPIDLVIQMSERYPKTKKIVTQVISSKDANIDQKKLKELKTEQVETKKKLKPPEKKGASKEDIYEEILKLRAKKRNEDESDNNQKFNELIKNIKSSDRIFKKKPKEHLTKKQIIQEIIDHKTPVTQSQYMAETYAKMRTSFDIPEEVFFYDKLHFHTSYNS